jgi:hypothetical protein
MCSETNTLGVQENKIYLALLHSLGISHKKFHFIFKDNLFKQEKNYKNFYENLNSEILNNY